MYWPNLKSVALPVLAITAIEGLGWVVNRQSWGREGRRGSGMVLFKRALVTSYRPSIVTFPLSLRISEILPFCAPACHFSHPTFSLRKISPCSPGNGWMAFGLQRAKVLG